MADITIDINTDDLINGGIAASMAVLARASFPLSITIGIASTLQSALGDGEAAKRLAAISNILDNIDQTLLDGFSGLDPSLRRLERERDEATADRSTANDGLRRLREGQERVAEGLNAVGNLLVSFASAPEMHVLSERVDASTETINDADRGLTARQAEIAEYGRGVVGMVGTSTPMQELSVALADAAERLAACGCPCGGLAPPGKMGEKNNPFSSIGPLSNTNAKGFFSFQPVGAEASVASSAASDKLLTTVDKGKELVQVLDEIEATTSRTVTPAMDELGQMITDVFANAARDGKITADEIGKVFVSMALDILEQQIFSQMGPFGQIAGSLLGGLLGFAGGGAVQPGMPVLVGERGPEVFVPPMPGRVMNNADSRAAFGRSGQNVTIHQTIKIEPTTKNDLFAMIQAARPALREDAKQAVFNALNHIRY